MSNESEKYPPIPKESLAKRGYCCGNKCKNCPYDPKWTKNNTKLYED